MAKRKNSNRNQQPIAWTDVWKRIQDTVARLDAPEEIRQAALAGDTEWWTKGDTMYLFIPNELREYIELNMDEFKPILWPFLQSHHCSKLIYD